MEENVDFEEDGSCYKALSHIDERVERVLGHFRKDFEGLLTSEKLGQKFGSYGSLLLAYEQRSSSLFDPKASQKDEVSKSSIELPSEGVPRKPKNPAKDPPYVRYGAASAHDSNDLPLKEKTRGKTGNLSKQRSQKFRIKFSSNQFSQKIAAIYRALGLDDSPLLSSGSSSDQSAGMPPPKHQLNIAESPTQILQVMTSEVVPGGVLVSPLHDSLLCLSTKEKVCKEEGKLLKEKKNKPESVKKKSVDLQNNGNNINSENVKRNLIAKSRDIKQYSTSTLAKRDSVQKLAIFNNDNLVHKDGSRSEGGKAYAPSKDFSDAVNVRQHSDPQKQKLSQKGAKFNNRQSEELVFRDKTNEKSSTEKVVCNGEDEDVIDDWVMCDRCQKWRLLPFETNPEQLPEKWLCSMLNWLPGMNSCDISEEETTNARNALLDSGRGDAKQLKKNRKIVADQLGLGTGTSKKFKANGDSSMDKHWSIEGRRTLTGCLNTARRKSMQKQNRIVLAAGAKYGAADKLVGGYTKTFSDCQSIDSKLSDEKGSSLKKQSLKKSQDDQNFQTSTGSINGEEELREWGKSLLPNNKRKLFRASNPDDKPAKKGKVMFFNVSSNANGFVDGTYKVQSLCKDHKSKLRNKAVY